MTTTRNAKTKTCSVCRTRPIDQKLVADCATWTFCLPCYTEADWENMHSDDAHDQMLAEDPDCWVCNPSLNEASDDYVAPVKATAATTRKTYSSHADCGHDGTPVARAKCRKLRNLLAEVTALAVEIDYIGAWHMLADYIDGMPAAKARRARPRVEAIVKDLDTAKKLFAMMNPR